MIVKSKAIETKTATANSTYYAVIIRVIPTYNDLTLNLQVYCPDVMSGTPHDALYSMTNIVEAPVKPHNGENVEDYDYQVGGIVCISYQNGNVNSPQFVRYVEVKNNIIEINKAYIDGVPITYDTVIFDVNNLSGVDLSSDGIQKGVALLPIIKKFAPTGGIFHTYGYDKLSLASELNGRQYLTIYRCGDFGVEYVMKRVNKVFATKPEEGEFDYFDASDTYSDISPRVLIKDFMSASSTSNSKLIDIVNKTIKEFTDLRIDVYSNEADALFWYTKLAGYIYDNDASYNIINNSEFENIKQKGITITPVGKGLKEKLYHVIYQNGISKISLYRGTFRTDGLNDTIKTDTFQFINKLWNNLSNDNYFNERMSTFYAAALVNNIMNMKNTYGVKSLTNKALIICASIATAFPVLSNVVANFELANRLNGYYTNTDRIASFIKNMTDCMSNDKKLTYTAEKMAEYFTDLYFQVLNWPMPSSGTKLFEDVDNPDTKIRQRMTIGINYILDNYNSISGVLDDNESTSDSSSTVVTSSGFTWPAPSCKTITSHYGYRYHPIYGKNMLHTGIDIGCVLNSKIVAAKEGTVTYAGWYGGYGNYIKIKHSDNYYTAYGHLNSILVSKGDKVAIGQQIAKSGSTGNSTGPHLHFEIISGSTYLDPEKYVK